MNSKKRRLQRPECHRWITAFITTRLLNMGGYQWIYQSGSLFFAWVPGNWLLPTSFPLQFRFSNEFSRQILSLCWGLWAGTGEHSPRLAEGSKQTRAEMGSFTLKPRLISWEFPGIHGMECMGCVSAECLYPTAHVDILFCITYHELATTSCLSQILYIL
jgi:hypothetical protein